MLVSAIGKFNTEKNTSGANSTFYGDKSIDITERCKPHYDIKSVDLTNKNSKNKDNCEHLNVLA